ncbi:histidine ammonia-lyase [Lacihabitans sp. LS3-19]|uniref:histidine ammonia-lyase n=1 Tax=Lacihabitans sp. LS3-19 TaxID=2487335 RepID=UPI0020CE7289|nr:histidine ammonia-lyase [Lacihabitans sp. LS3-19]MCP9768388.1 histidine ammonia-lyase [Lacihabitans sp. LS3-19]
MFKYGEDFLGVNEVLALVNGELKGEISENTLKKINKSSSWVDEIVASSDIVYGINTGFGPLCDTKISESQTSELQHNLLISHSVGVGEPIALHLAKAMMICKVHSLCQAFSGIRLETIERILWMIDEDIIPMVPCKGSVGASGDLAPLSHLFLPLIGLGEVFYLGEKYKTVDLLYKLDKTPLTLGPKEGLALINGTQFILAHAVYGVSRLFHCLEIADIVGALSLEGLMGSAKPFDKRLHDIRNYEGSQWVAQRLRRLLEGSEILVAHHDCDRVQDPYSLRCMPQAHGASRNAYIHLKQLTEIELNSVTDNPIVLGSHDTISGGNFHGQPLALPLDYCTLAAAELGNISDRRCYLMLEGRYGLPRLLLEDTGLNSGFMIPQYTTAALVSENKSLCFPASADSIPTSLGQEDHVSMGSISGRKFHSVLDNLEYILAIELLYAAQALEFRRPLKSSEALEEIFAEIRKHVEFATKDRSFSYDINTLHQLIKSPTLTNIVSNKLKANESYEKHCIA